MAVRPGGKLFRVRLRTGHLHVSVVSRDDPALDLCVAASARPSSPDSHPTASDFMGSQATILVSLQPQRLHSKVRRSKPSGPASTSAVSIGARH
jgi:hypothetical protein